MQINVVRNAKKNIVFGVVNKMIVLICPFIERFLINTVLGPQYLGLGSLFTSILTMLSLTELGFSTAMVYNMYKPAAEGDIKKMNALLAFYRTVYRIIGLVILAVGSMLIPLLPRLIKGTYPADINLTRLYLLYLANTAASYFLFAYMSSVIVVHQRDDIKSLINSLVKIGLTVSQVAVLILTKNYYLFTALMLLFTIINNILLAWRVHTLFPQYHPEGELPAGDRGSIRRHVAGTFINQACQVTRNSLDSICISAFLGLTLTGIYNNYYLIIYGVTTFLNLVVTSFTGGIGNHVATRSMEDNYEEMKKLDFVFLWAGSWCMTCMLCLYQPFVTLWMGKDMLLPMSAVILLCMYFYMLKLGDIRAIYSSASGLWWEQRYRAVGETLLNLILNVWLGKTLGVHGIILATMISLFLCNYLWSARITFQKYFSLEKLRDYYRYQGKQTLLAFAAAAAAYLVCHLIPAGNALIRLVINLTVCILIPNVIFIIAYRDTDYYRYARSVIFHR